MNNEPKYSIKSVSRLTGLSTHLIRAWERRYQVIKPGRTNTNRRLYSDDDVERLRLLTQATSMGFNIGSISNFSNEKLKGIMKSHPLVTSDQEIKEETFHKGQSDLSSALLKDSIESIKDYSAEKLKDILLKASIDLGQRDLMNLLLIPVINYIGENWQNGSLSIAQEHMASSVIVNFLQYLKGMYKNAVNAPILISTTPHGEFHELGALMISSVAASEGWNVIHLGTNLPIDDLIKASEETSAKVICLSLVYLAYDLQVGHYLTRLNEYAGDKRKIIIGGRSSKTYINAIKGTKIKIIEDLNKFRLELNELR